MAIITRKLKIESMSHLYLDIHRKGLHLLVQLVRISNMLKTNGLSNPLGFPKRDIGCSLVSCCMTHIYSVQ